MLTERKNTPKSWGNPGAPLLPAALRDAWVQVKVPEWARADLKLPEGATLGMLEADTTLPPGRTLGRIQRFLAETLVARLPQLERVKAFGHAWPADLDPASVPWRVRTRNRLINGRIFDHLDRLPTLTFGDLTRIPQLGPMGILDFLATLEATTGRLSSGTLDIPITSHVGEGASPPDVEGAELILDVLDEDWIDNVSRDDPRFVRLLPPIHGTMFEAVDELTSGVRTGSEATRLLEAIVEAIPSVRAEAERIRALSVEEALRELVAGLVGGSSSRVDALLQRLNWQGSPHGVTLEEAGRVAGVTRERVRQLEKEVRKRAGDRRLYLPQVDRAMQVLAEHAPIDALEASRLLHRHGVSSAAFHPKSILAVASALNRTPLILVERRRGRDFVVREPVNAAADRIIAIAFRQLSQVGTTNIEGVSSELQTDGIVLSDEEVAQVIGVYTGAVFTVGSWFWCPARPHSTLVTQAKRMLSVVSPMNVGSLREGMKRALRFRQISGGRGRALVVPTRAALFEYLRGHPDFVVSAEDDIRYARPLDYRKELPASEQIVVQALGESPSGVLDRGSLQAACVSRGLNRNTFAVLTTYSPVLVSLGYGLWTLRGRTVDPAAVEVLRQLSNERPRERRVVNYGWTPQGKLWVAIRLPEDPCSVLPHVPSTVVRYLTSPDYIARTASGMECGRVRIYQNGNSSGYAPFLQQAGADEGDILMAEFDIASASVALYLADEEELEQIEGAA